MKGKRVNIDNIYELECRVEDEKNPVVKLKLIFLNLVAHNPTDFENICKLCGIPGSTGYQWIREWNDRGYLNLMESLNTGGRPPKLSDSELNQLKGFLEEKEYWLTKEVKILIKEKFDVDLSEDQIVRIMREKFEMNFSKPFPVDYRKSDDAEQILEKQLELILAQLKEKGFKAEEIALGFVDETRPQNTSNTVRVWSFGKVRIIKNTTKFNTNTIGFYAIKGESVKGFLDNSKKESIAKVLDIIKKANEKYKAIVIIIDNFSSHKSTLVKDKAKELGIYLLYLPPYSPELNPIEYIWKSLKRIISLIFPKNVDEMKTAISEGWNEFSKSLSFAGRWIEKFLKGKPYYEGLCG